MKQPFLEISDCEWAVMCDQKMTTDQLMEKYKQPDWCHYPDALAGTMGCWSLTGRTVTGRDFCKSCECSEDYGQETHGLETTNRESTKG